MNVLFYSGSYDIHLYDPKYLIDKEVIVVSINYRLGPLGFLSLGTEDVPGNAGFLDQIMALKWVQTNIQNFGGDSSSITIFGESAGSFSVAAHILSPLSEGLFQRAICESGTTINPGWHAINGTVAVNYAAEFSRRLNCDQVDDVLERL